MPVKRDIGVSHCSTNATPRRYRSGTFRAHALLWTAATLGIFGLLVIHVHTVWGILALVAAAVLLWLPGVEA